MKKTSSLEKLIVVFIIAIPLIYTALIYPTLPATIPIHFDINGNPNGFADKPSIFFAVLVIAAVSGGVYLLIKNLPRIDPKKSAGQSPDVYQKIAMGIVIFLCAISLMVVYASAKGSFNMKNLLFPLMGLFFAFLGNYMHSIKPNYFVGFRTPWTLESEDNWRKTHQLVGKIWVPGGLLIAVMSLLLPTIAGVVVVFSIILLMVFIPGVYSYLYFKKHRSD